MRSITKLAAALLAALTLGGVAQAQCRINVAVQNQENAAIEVLNTRQAATSVRTRVGTWLDLRRGGWFDGEPLIRLQPGARQSDVYRAGFGCNANRRFRVEYRCAGGRQTRAVYFPGPNGFTDRQNVTVRLRGLGC